jgi:hypothetical protein
MHRARKKAGVQITISEFGKTKKTIGQCPQPPNMSRQNSVDTFANIGHLQENDPGN